MTTTRADSRTAAENVAYRRPPADRVQPAWPGEVCQCGGQARSALVTLLGRLPSCVSVDTLRKKVEQSVEWSRGPDR